MNYIFKILQQANDEIKALLAKYLKYYKAGVHCAYIKLIKYFSLTDQTLIYWAAIVLHPTYKFNYFKQKWANKATWQLQCKKDITVLCKQYEEKYAQLKDEENNKPVTPERLIHKKRCNSDSLLLGKKGFNFYDMLTNEYRACKCQRLESKLKYFIKNTPTKAEQYIVNLLAYWQSIKHVYPILYCMAMDLFSIPAMSSECEHEFSSANNVITDDQNHLADETIEALEFQKNWLNKGHIKKDENEQGV